MRQERKDSPQNQEQLKEVVDVRKQSLMQHKNEGEGDAMCCSMDTSRWSTPSSLHCASNSLHYSSDFEDKADSFADKTPEAKSPRGKKAKGPHRPQAKNYATTLHVFKLPPIKPLQISRPPLDSDNFNCIRELRSKVWDLKQQLSEVKTENKLLKKLQHRHTMALQHYQDSEGSLSQILTKQNNEARVLQGLLHETRICRDNLARQLQAKENKLLNTKASLQHLQQLSQDQSLLEREELTVRLTNATAELEEKDKRIVDLERNLELCQASFNRQIITEQRKINKARQVSYYLQEQLCQQSKEIQDKQRVLETHNIYSHKFQKRLTKKESKTVQTDGLILLPTEAARLLKLDITETDERLEEDSSVKECCYNPVQEFLLIETPNIEVSANVTLEENVQEDTETFADASQHNSCPKERLEDDTEGDSVIEKEASEVPKVSEKGQETEEHESSEKSLNTAEPKRNANTPPKIRCNYTFKRSIKNLHNGIPASSRVDLNPYESSKSLMSVETHSCKIGALHLPAGKSRRSAVRSPQCE
uniref:lebercilin-like protein isoform X2 n=1 Tax=Scatophagus argus TaxID=75038 RepID=UPI001ED80979|nr:lebercilin-like protein isoform X2 [Scatophagus argus]